MLLMTIMSPELQGWAQLVTAVGILLSIVFSYLRGKRADERAATIERKTDAVVTLVNGPLTKALKTNVALAERVAAGSGLKSDEEIAADARAVSKNHEAAMDNSKSPAVPVPAAEALAASLIEAAGAAKKLKSEGKV